MQSIGRTRMVNKFDLPSNVLKIDEIKKGYKKRKKYIVETTKRKYFIKVLPYKVSLEEIEKIKWIYKIYEKENIPIVPLDDIILKKNTTILVYDYFEGNDLKDSLLTLEQYKNYGMKVSLEVKKMNRIRNYPNVFKRFDLKEHCNIYIDEFKKVISNEKEKMYNLFSDKEINNLILRFENLCEHIIKNDEVMLNHNDVKIRNIMINNKNDIYLVDIDPIDLTYRGFNINYSIYTFLFNNSLEKAERAFLKGFIQEYDPDKQLIREYEYFIISDFINELEMLLSRYYDYLKNNQSFIKKVLFNENNILTQILYN